MLNTEQDDNSIKEFEDNEFINNYNVPPEYYDSDEDDDFSFMDHENPFLYKKIVQKAFSIFSIRKLNCLFKSRRRRVFNPIDKMECVVDQ